MYAKSNTTEGEKICEHFIKLYKFFPNIKTNIVKDTKYKNDWYFLNYWLNIKFNESMLDKSKCVYYYYEGMENHCMNTLSSSTYSSKLIYDINQEDLNRMKALYILHENYSKLDNILNKGTPQEPESLLEPSRICSYTYKSARYMCNEKYEKFCEKLDKFKIEYDKLHITAKTKGEQFANNLKKLTDYDNSNIISTTLIGSAVGLIPLLGILYKFTPIGQKLKSQKRKLSKGHSNNIDEIIKTSLLNYENDQLNLKQEKYNIEYHPSRIR
ncbi:hypothetical protein PVIIG_05849 [Plasmodium vivax India VII]|uniref:VIR protein n=1 Tax=Plasmodium vivax India VII TaxID=1077284 RepID=A0A0J9UTL4_PLAVI|nr:hypothetical protein PVIIG_05849 [Plasmodium vivax India VII]